MTLILYFAAALILPPAIIIFRNGDVIQVLPLLLSSFGFALLIYALVNLLRSIGPRIAVIVGTLVFLAALLIRFLLGFLYDFSGFGFTGEFFAHTNITSLKLGLQEYDHEAWIMLFLFSGLIYITVRLINKDHKLSIARSVILILIALPLVYTGSSASPELQLANAYQRYSQPGSIDQNSSVASIREQSSHVLQGIRPMGALPIDKSRLEASLPDKPLNLILIYLESFNETLSGDVTRPGLTPRIDVLKKRYHSFDQIHSSAYVTIEGIANSQCGTLVNMDYANSSLTTREGRLPNLPCLGDILRTAGYHQTYLGGADLDFAGKGAFFRDHGYDDVHGWKHWDKLGFERASPWGLSDTVLFDQAFETIQKRRDENQPFNLTLLTLGTHTPGFVYDGCPTYTDDPDQPYVNAIHCTDHLLGEFVEKLEQNGILDDTVLYIQADHGSFITPEILRQVGHKVGDTRLLTIMALPDSVQMDQEQLKPGAEGTSLDTVASLLEVMSISHNTTFIFSRSHFSSPRERNYFLTRRQDYADKKRYDADRYQCDEPNRTTPPVLPLDNCDKNRVMQALYALNLSYSPRTSNDNRICDLAAEVNIEADTGKVQVKWGNQNLSNKFIRRGSKRNKHQTQGIYAVMLDEQQNVTQTLFYESVREEDMRNIQETLDTAHTGQRMLLIRNIDMADLAPDVDEKFPELLRTQSIIYGVFDGERLVPEFVSTDSRPNSRFTPASCNQPKA